MKRRRILAGASALLIGTALLAGCNGGGGSKGTGTYGGVDIAKLEKPTSSWWPTTTWG